MVQIESQNRRGKPKEWTDEQLKELALSTKYKHQMKKLTPSLLEKETGIGRNTWSRRAKEIIDDLNAPVLRSITIDDDNQVALPSTEIIFMKHEKNMPELKNEFLKIEILLFDLYKENKELKQKEDLFQKSSQAISDLKDELKRYKKKAMHYEQLYNTIVASSVFPHLHGKSPKLIEHDIQDSLIDFNAYNEKILHLDNLSEYFPAVSEKSILKVEEDELINRRMNNMSKLTAAFNLSDE